MQLSKRKHQKRALKETLLTDSTFEGGDARESLATETLKNRAAGVDFEPSINGQLGNFEVQGNASIKPDADELDLGEGIAQLQKYKKIFDNLTDKHEVPTGEGQEVIEVIITYDAQSAICMTRDSLLADTNQEEYKITCYSLTSFRRRWDVNISGNHLRMNEILQTNDASTFAVTYQDSGVFHVKVFDNEGAEVLDLNVSDVLGIDAGSKPIHGVFYPLITACFIPNDRLFICAYHRYKRRQYHFVYSLANKAVEGEPQHVDIVQCSQRNYPIKSFYSEETKECYTFYRQSQCFTMALDAMNLNVLAAQAPKLEKISDSELGSMYLLFDKALVTQSSGTIMFFKKDKNNENAWTLYHKIPKMRGQLYFIRGNIRIQVTTDERIYFYIIDKETLLPRLENVMNNFMGCSQMMFGSKVRFCVTFKQNEKDFHVWCRRAYHNFKCTMSAMDLEGAVGANLPSSRQCVIAHGHEIKVQDIGWESEPNTFLIPTKDEMDKEILYITVSQDELRLGICVGQKLAKEEVVVTEIVIYARSSIEEPFELRKMRDFEFHDACLQFTFSVKNSDELLFAAHDRIFIFNYMDEGAELRLLHALENPLVSKTVNFVVFDKYQQICVIVSDVDCVYCKLPNRGSPAREVDLDDQEDIKTIQNVICDDEYAYVLANKHEDHLGFYLLKISLSEPTKGADYIIKWKNKLDIDDCDLYLMYEEGDKQGRPGSIIVSYKMIGYNTYNVFVIDLIDKDSLIKYWHESYALWESPVRGFLLSNNDYLVISKDGIQLLALGNQKTKTIKDAENQMRCIHSLGSVDYLKIEPRNHLLFACQFYEDRQICVQEQYTEHNKADDDSKVVKSSDTRLTKFNDIYRIKVHEITLRELLLIQSIYVAKESGSIYRLVKDQPTPQVFLKVFLELEVKSLVSFLAFDNQAINNILHDFAGVNREYFPKEFPVFFRNADGLSAIDYALDANQIRSVNTMIDYICEFQNDWVYSNLFYNNIVTLLTKGVSLKKLFNSNVFRMKLEAEGWPAQHQDTSKLIRAYSESIFDLKFAYDQVFPVFSISNPSVWQQGRGKMYKIMYNCYSLTSMNEDTVDGRLMDALAESDELEIFSTDLVHEIIDFKWQEFAGRIHNIGAFMHFTFAIILQAYIKWTFIFQQPITAEGMVPIEVSKKSDADYIRYAIQYTIMPDHRYHDRRIYPDAEIYSLTLTGILLLYQVIYEVAQFCKKGASIYFAANWRDCLLIVLGYLNIYMQICVGTWDLWSKVVMILLVVLTMFKTFEFLRVVQSFSYIVTMIRNVMWDLRVFGLFFVIVIVSFSGVLDCFGRNRSDEYIQVGPAWANIFATLRLSLGDFDFSLIEMQELYWMHVLFWAAWVMMVFFSSLVFLNFIIAEVGNSYQSCKDTIDQNIFKERANLIAEAEDLYSSKTKRTNTQKFPKYVIVRSGEVGAEENEQDKAQ